MNNITELLNIEDNNLRVINISIEDFQKTITYQKSIMKSNLHLGNIPNFCYFRCFVSPSLFFIILSQASPFLS